MKIREALAAGDANKAGTYVDAHIAGTMSAFGSKEEVKKRLREFVRVGKDKFQPIIFLIGGDLELGIEAATDV